MEDDGASTLDDSAEVRTLRRHLVERGAYINDAIVCAAMDDGSYRGVKAIRDLEKDSVLISIPEALLMSARSAKRDPAIQRATQMATRPITDIQLLAVHLLHEASKGETSVHHIYLKTLPHTFDNFLFLTDADVESLASTHPHAAREAAEAKASLLESFHAVQPILRALSMPKYSTLGAFRWSMACVQSRTMSMGLGDTAGCLTPWGDLHNHTPMLRPHTPWNDGCIEDECAAVAGEGFFDEHEQRYVLVTRVPVQAGRQVFLTYGRLTNLQLLNLYGFVLAENPWDTCRLPLARFPDSIQRHLTEEACYLHADGSPSFDLMRAVRLGVLKDAERKRWAGIILDDRPVDWNEGDCERRALETLSNVVLQTIDEDVHTYEAQRSPVRDWRRAQNNILQRFLCTSLDTLRRDVSR